MIKNLVIESQKYPYIQFIEDKLLKYNVSSMNIRKINRFYCKFLDELSECNKGTTEIYKYRVYKLLYEYFYSCLYKDLKFKLGETEEINLKGEIIGFIKWKLFNGSTNNKTDKT